MFLSIELVLSLLVLGVIVGFLAGLLGIGGGAIMLAVLVSLFANHGVATDSVIYLALGTSMAAIVFTSASSSWAHHRAGRVDWTIVKGLAPGVIVATFVTGYFVAYFNKNFLSLFFASFVAYISLSMFRKPKVIDQASTTLEPKLPSALGLSAVGYVIGSISALVSIGGGSLTVPYLTRYRVPIKRAIACSAALGLPLSIAGAAGYLLAHNSHPVIANTIGWVHVPAALLISVTSFVFAPIGAKCAGALPVAVLRKLFAFLLAGLCIKMLVTVIA